MDYANTIGQRFGDLTVLELGPTLKEKTGSRKTLRCKCICDKEILVRGASLVKGKKIHCGCKAYLANSVRLIKQQDIEITVTCSVCQQKFNTRTTLNLKKTCSKACFRSYRNQYIRKRTSSTLKNKLESRYRTLKTRAKKNNLNYELSLEDLFSLYKKQEGRCAITRFELVLDTDSPWGLSVDRIDNSKGYTKDNIRLVCKMYNYCKHTWTDDEVRIMIKAIRLEEDM